MPAPVPYQLASRSALHAQTFSRFQRAELLDRLGRRREALGWYASIGEGSRYDIPFLAPSIRRQAEIHTALGDRKRAAHYSSRLVEFEADTDAEIKASARLTRKQVD